MDVYFLVNVEIPLVLFILYLFAFCVLSHKRVTLVIRWHCVNRQHFATLLFFPTLFLLFHILLTLLRSFLYTLVAALGLGYVRDRFDGFADYLVLGYLVDEGFLHFGCHFDEVVRVLVLVERHVD